MQTTQPTAPKELSPEDQLRNVAHILIEETRAVRSYNGRGRSAVYEAGVDTIAGTGRQLAEMVIAYLNKELPPIPLNDGLPF
ncbi:MAG: hypothetical protein U0X20_17270 [Caldilineaceae bacterium]